MGVRLKRYHQEVIKQKLRGVHLLKLAQDYALSGQYNGKPIEPQRVNVAQALLRKILPDVQTAVLDIDVHSHQPTGQALLAEISAIQTRLGLTPAPLERDITPTPELLLRSPGGNNGGNCDEDQADTTEESGT